MAESPNCELFHNCRLHRRTLVSIIRGPPHPAPRIVENVISDSSQYGFNLQQGGAYFERNLVTRTAGGFIAELSGSVRDNTVVCNRTWMGGAVLLAFTNTASFTGNSFYNNGTYDVELRFDAGDHNLALNYWGTSDVSAIAVRIFDRADNPALGGAVTFQPFLSAPSVWAPASDCPVTPTQAHANDDAFTVSQGQSLSITPPGVLQNDVVPPGETPSVQFVAFPIHGWLFNSGGGGFVYSPLPGFSGTEVLRYVLQTSAGTSNEATVQITVQPPPPPQLHSVGPGSARQGTTIPRLVVEGSGFQPGARLAFSATGISVQRYLDTTATQIAVEVRIQVGAAEGLRDVTVTNPNGQSAVMPNGFVVIAGTSNVAFLPGIMGTRLYSSGFFGDDQLWPAHNDGDMCELRPNEDGSSMPGIFPGTIIDFGAGGLWPETYAGFSRFLDGLREQGTINNWSPLPYDSRMAVDEIARGFVASVESLAAESQTGRVTLVGHSNGGLVAKMLVRELEQRGKSSLIDRIVLVATPQLGTPDSVPALLHGETATPWLVTEAVAREAGETMIGAYTLLPTKSYFKTALAVVEFAPSSTVLQRPRIFVRCTEARSRATATMRTA